jgi:hypothetical protein
MTQHLVAVCGNRISMIYYADCDREEAGFKPLVLTPDTSEEK